MSWFWAAESGGRVGSSRLLRRLTRFEGDSSFVGPLLALLWYSRPGSN